MSLNSQCIHHLIEYQVSQTPDKVAFVFQEESLTYRELNEWANRVAHSLIKNGIKPEDLVGLRMGRSVELVIAVLGVLKAGAAYIPLDPQYPSERIEYMASDSKATFFLNQKDIKDCSKIGQNENPKLTLSSTNLAYVLYTSGSTGKPKGVEISHGSVVNFLESMVEILEFSENEIVVSVTGLTFDIAGLDLYLTLMKGGTLVFVPRSTIFDGNLLRKALDDTRATLVQTTPVIWRSLFAAGWSAPQGFKALCGGENLPRALLADFLQQPLRLWNLYGPTETTIWSTFVEINSKDPSQTITVGRPIANTQIYLLNDALERVPDGEVGEVHIGGLGLARGYRGRPELTAEKFIANPFGNGKLYKTGDLGRILPSGELELLGRIDHQIKLRGYRIEPREIEDAIERVTGIKESLVVLKQLDQGPALVAYLVAPGSWKASDYQENIAKILPEYMIPSYWVTLLAFPQTPNGKIDRNALPDPVS